MAHDSARTKRLSRTTPGTCLIDRNLTDRTGRYPTGGRAAVVLFSLTQKFRATVVKFLSHVDQMTCAVLDAFRVAKTPLFFP
jgi:hypothetical protein